MYYQLCTFGNFPTVASWYQHQIGVMDMEYQTPYMVRNYKLWGITIYFSVRWKTAVKTLLPYKFIYDFAHLHKNTKNFFSLPDNFRSYMAGMGFSLIHAYNSGLHGSDSIFDAIWYVKEKNTNFIR